MMTDSAPTTRWHQLEAADVAARLDTDSVRGLEPAEAARRLAQGANRLPKEPQPSWVVLLARQFQSPLVLVLVGALALSAALGEWVDAAAIAVIVILNAIIGFAQEQRAEHALAALESLAVPRAVVVRGGTRLDIQAADTVPGDLIVLEAGDLVPADARVVSAASLRADEAPLTGESTPVSKRTDPVEGDALADRRNMLYLGTHVAAGKATALVVATGAATELGRIARLISQSGREATPLQRRLEHFSQVLLRVALAIVAVVFIAGVARGEAIGTMLLTAVSLAVAAIPEGLPAIVTIALALGVSRMARRNALVRRLPAVETLGAATVICTDKTGTLTRGEMMVSHLLLGRDVITVTGDGYEPRGSFSVENPAAGEPPASLDRLLRAAVLASDARLREESGQWRIIGDPTEGALVVVAEKRGLAAAALDAQAPRVLEAPFDADRKRMTVVRREPNGLTAYVKGAPDVLLPRCVHVLDSDGRVVPLDPETAAFLAGTNATFAGQALRVLAVASRPVDRLPDTDASVFETDLTWLGLVAMRDAPRPEARTAVEACQTAGIRTVMITGDHPETAAAIAATLGLSAGGGGVMIGRDLDALDDTALTDRVVGTTVYARVSAEHKLRIVRAWRKRGAIVAMTGDGVNDAPALKEADIGVAMGRTGTAVAREAADLVVTDDNFASIVAAVAEGRGIYENIRKSIQYLLSCNLSEILVMLLATLVGLPLPLMPVQILWLNLVTDGFPALALAVEPAEPDLMRRPPRPPEESLLDRPRFVRIALQGLFMALVAMALFVIGQSVLGFDVARCRALTFTGLVFSQLAQSLNCRSERHSLFTLGLLSNPMLLLAVLGGAVIQVLLTMAPFTASVLHLVPMTLAEWALAGAAGLLPLAGMEIEKAWRRARPTLVTAPSQPA
jgi:Ca2+-transporting ATPase